MGEQFSGVVPGYPKHWIPILVHPEEYEEIKRQGIARNENGKKLGWVSKTTDADYTWDIIGCAGEWAVSMLLNKPVEKITSANITDLRGGDVAGLEVKTSRSSDPRLMDLCVNADQLEEDSVYVSVYAGWLPQWIVIGGWETGARIKSFGKKRRHSGTGHEIFVLNRSELRDPLGLFDIIRAKANLHSE